MTTADDFNLQGAGRCCRRKPALLRRLADRHHRADRAADDLLVGRLADLLQPDRHRDRVRAVLQHPARPDRPAVVRPRRALRPRRLRRLPHDECGGVAWLADPAAVHPVVRRDRRPRVCDDHRLGHDQARRHGVRDDLARHRRIGGVLVADPALGVRRRVRHHHGPHRACRSCWAGRSGRSFRSII